MSKRTTQTKPIFSQLVARVERSVRPYAKPQQSSGRKPRATTPNKFSSLLFTQPSLFEGISTLFDLGDTQTEYNGSLSARQADLLALRADRRAIFADFRLTIARMRTESGVSGTE